MRYRQHDPQTKLAAALAYAAVCRANKTRSCETVDEVCAAYKFNRSQLGAWLTRLRDQAEAVFARKPNRRERLRTMNASVRGEEPGESDDVLPPVEPESAFAELEAECERLGQENVRLKKELGRAIKNYQAVVQQARSRIPKFVPKLDE